MIFSAGGNKSHLLLREAVARREKRAEELSVSLEGRLTPAGGLAPGYTRRGMLRSAPEG